MTRCGISLLWVLLGSACCAAPTIAPAAGTSGPYVHLGSDTQSSRSGLGVPESGWPPKDVAAQGGSCADEKARVERDLGVTSLPCPAIQTLKLPVAETIPDDDGEIPAGPGLDIRCYSLGGALLVVEYAQTAVQCSHVIGLGVFHSAGEVKP